MQYKESLNEELIELLDDISAYRDINNDFPNRNFEKELFELEELALKLFKLKLSKYEGYSKVKVAVIGNFSSGKSSFINSLLGAEVCPVKVNPTTSSVTKFVYGDSEEIFLIEEKRKKPISREEYYSKCQHEITNMERSRAYFFEYRYPSPVLKNIELYDTPGFDNKKNPQDEKITEEIAVKRADVILFIQDIQRGTLEKSTIEKIKELKKLSSAKEWYLVFNKADSKPKRELKEIEENFEASEVKQFFSAKYFYSAKRVLEALKKADDKFIENFKVWLKNLEEGKFELFIEKKLEKDSKKGYLAKKRRHGSVKSYVIEISTGKKCRSLKEIILAKFLFAKERNNDRKSKIFRFKVLSSSTNSEYLKERERLIKVFNKISAKKDQYIKEEIDRLSKEYDQKKKIILEKVMSSLNFQLFYSERLPNLLEIVKNEFPFVFPKFTVNSEEIFCSVILDLLSDLIKDLGVPVNYKEQIVNSFKVSLKEFIAQINNPKYKELFSEEQIRVNWEIFSRLTLLNIIQSILKQEENYAKFKVKEIEGKIKVVLHRHRNTR